MLPATAAANMPTIARNQTPAQGQVMLYRSMTLITVVSEESSRLGTRNPGSFNEPTVDKIRYMFNS